MGEEENEGDLKGEIIPIDGRRPKVLDAAAGPMALEGDELITGVPVSSSPTDVLSPARLLALGTR